MDRRDECKAAQSPRPRRPVPSCSAIHSSVRVLVEPTATTRWPDAFVRVDLLPRSRHRGRSARLPCDDFRSGDRAPVERYPGRHGGSTESRSIPLRLQFRQQLRREVKTRRRRRDGAAMGRVDRLIALAVERLRPRACAARRAAAAVRQGRRELRSKSPS